MGSSAMRLAWCLVGLTLVVVCAVEGASPDAAASVDPAVAEKVASHIAGLSVAKDSDAPQGGEDSDLGEVDDAKPSEQGKAAKVRVDAVEPVEAAADAASALEAADTTAEGDEVPTPKQATTDDIGESTEAAPVSDSAKTAVDKGGPNCPGKNCKQKTEKQMKEESAALMKRGQARVEKELGGPGCCREKGFRER